MRVVRVTGVVFIRLPRTVAAVAEPVPLVGGGVGWSCALDCLDQTPLLNIKSYVPSTDAEPEAAMGMAGEAPDLALAVVRRAADWHSMRRCRSKMREVVQIGTAVA